MRRFVLAVSLAHLLLLPAYVKLGAVNPWQAVNFLFGGGFLWLVMMFSAIAAPFLMGTLGWVIDAALKRWSRLWVSRVRESAFVILAIGSILSLTNAVLLADRTVEHNFRVTLVSFVTRHLLVFTTLAFLVGFAFLCIILISTPIRKRMVRLLRPYIFIFAPAVLISILGISYLLVMATPPERPGESLPRSGLPPPVSGSPQSVVVLLFDGLSYSIVFRGGEVDERLPNLRALAQQSLVFHDVRSYSSYSMDNIPPLLTGQIYDAIKLDSQQREVGHIIGGQPIVLQEQRNIFDVAHDQGYRVAASGYFLRYCSTYVKDTGYCKSTSADELNSEPYSFIQATLEIYRLAAAKTLPTSVGYRLESMVGSTFLSLIDSRVFGIHDTLLSTLKDARGQFVYAHYPVPHIPYLRIESETGKLRASGATYFDSVQAVDKILGDARQVLQESGAWEDTLLIIVSDHNDPAATSDVRVPLIIKMPSKTQHIDFDGPWTHVQFLPLLEELLHRRSFEPDSVMAILQELAPAE